jgi:hypothetical protein
MRIILFLLALVFSNLIGLAQKDANGNLVSNEKPQPSAASEAKYNILSLNFNFETLRPLTELNQNNQADAYPWISNDGKSLYYTRQGSPDDRIVKTTRENIWSLFSEPVELSVNLEGEDNLSPWLTADELHIFFVYREPNGQFTVTLYHASRSSVDESFGEPIAVTLLGNASGFIGGPSLTQDLDQLYLFNAEGTLLFEKVSDNVYALADILNAPNALESAPGQLSPDGLKYYAFLKTSSEPNTKLYMAERADIASSFTSIFLLDNNSLNSSMFNFNQPSISADGNFFVFTRTKSLWERNDLYIAQNNPNADTSICPQPFPPVEESSLITTFQGNGYLLEWAPVPNQIGCQIAITSAYGNQFGRQIVGGANASSYFVPESFLQNGTTYEWRVRCGCSQLPFVAGPWSLWQPFITPEGVSIISSPNPSDGHSFVSFSAANGSYATLEVLDLSGRLIQSLFSGTVRPDAEYRFEFDGSALPNGVYLYRLTTQTETVHEKFMIAR